MLNMIKRYNCKKQELTSKSLKRIEDTGNTDMQAFGKVMNDDRNSLDIFFKSK